MLIPFLGAILFNGYTVDTMRRVIQDDYDLLPEWDNWGRKLVDGLAMSVLALVWLIIAFIPFGLPPMLLLFLMDEPSTAVLVIGLIGFILWTLSVYIFMPVVYGRYADTSNFMEGLKVVEIIKFMRPKFGRYFGNLILAYLVLFAWMFLVSFMVAISVITVVGWICGIPLAMATGLYMALVQANLLGQLYRTVQ